MDIMWFDGRLRAADDIAVRPFTHALHYGSGVFEGIRAYLTDRGTAIFRLRDHIERLFRSAQPYGLQIAYDVTTLERAVFETLVANDFAEGYIRPLVFYGEKGISLAPRFQCPTHILIALKPLTGSLIQTSGGARLCVSPWQKSSSRALPATAKACGHYMNSILALQDAVARGFDDALLLNDRGEIAEASGENVFVVRNGELRTNDISADALDGITQDTVVQLARHYGIPINIGPIGLEDILSADEVFLTGTAAEVMPVAQVDTHQFSSERPVTEQLATAYGSAVRGRDFLRFGWLALGPAHSVTADGT